MLKLDETACICHIPGEGLTYAKLTDYDPKNEAFYLPTFNLKEINYHSLSEKKKIQLQDLKFSITSEISIEFERTDKKQFLEDFAYFKSLIEKGHIQKAVPITFQKSKRDLDFEETLKLCLNKLSVDLEGMEFYAYWNFEKKEFLIGLSPEILYEKQGNRVKSIALAGTKSPDQNIELLKDAKERKEHQWVIDDLKEKLDHFGDTKVGNHQIKRAGNLEHIASPIECNLKKRVKREELVTALHPSPALGVYPSNRLELLSERYPDNLRKYFGSPFCYFGQEKEKAIVAIRNLQYFNGCLWLFSGCGQVKESQEEKEWQELEAKRNNILDLLK